MKRNVAAIPPNNFERATRKSSKRVELSRKARPTDVFLGGRFILSGLGSNSRVYTQAIVEKFGFTSRFCRFLKVFWFFQSFPVLCPKFV